MKVMADDDDRPGDSVAFELVNDLERLSGWQLRVFTREPQRDHEHPIAQPFAIVPSD
jgi:hypothetical protein